MKQALLSLLSLATVAPFVASFSLAAPVAAQSAQEASFVLQMGADTFAVESFTRSGDRVEGVLAGRAMGRIVYTLSVGPDAVPTALSMRAWQPGAAPGAPPAQEAVITMEGETAIAEITAGGSTRTDRIPTRAGAVLYLNPSVVQMEQLVVRARAQGGDPVTLPLFQVQGGQTAEAIVTRLSPDSVTISLAGTVIRAAVDTEGRLRGGSIPAQGMTFVRVDRALSTEVMIEPVDYSAPDGAPYTAEDVVVQTAEGHVLAGTLTRPRTDAAVPAVVMITGSGAQDRDQAISILPGYRPFRDIADTLSRRGIAVLRLDDRGTGASTGDFSTATSEDFANDIRAGLAWLRERQDIDADRLGLVGHSEGGIIAPMIAASDPDLAAIVLIAGTAQTGREIIAYQQRESLERNAAIPEASRDSAFAAMQERFLEASRDQPWIRFFLDYDPLTAARQVRDTPVLILHGETDRQVTVDQAEILATEFRRAGNGDVTVRTFPEVNHLLLPDPDGSPSGYSLLRAREVVPSIRGELSEWLVSRLDVDSPEPEVTWSFQTDGPIYSSPTLDRDVVYVGSGDGHLYAVDRATGAERWRFRTGGAVDSAPATADGMVYALSRDGALYAVDAENGSLRWSYATDGERKLDFWDFYLSDPLVDGDRVVFGSGDGSVYSLDRVTGELRWRFRTPEIVHAAPIAAEGLVYVGGFDGVLYALNGETGAVAWRFETEGNPSFPRGDLQRGAVLRDGVLYVGSRDYHIYAIDAADGSLRWRQKEGNGWIIATPLLTDDAVLFGASDGQKFYALDRQTGDVSWFLPVHTRVFGTAVSVGELVVFGGFNGRLFAVDPASGVVQWSYQTPASRRNFSTVYQENGALNAEMRQLYQTQEGFRAAEERILTLGSIPGTPAVRGEMVYFATTEGVLYALDASKGR